MEILKKDKDIQDLFAEAISQENVELELIFGHNDKYNPIDKTLFLKLLDKLKEDYRFVEESNNLDIKCKNNKKISPIRCTIKDLNSIKKYCVTDSLDDIDNLEFVKKTYYNKPNLKTNIRNTDYNYRINLKIEENLNYDKDQILKYSGIHNTKSKYYRYKKRYSFETPDNLFRIDLTVVKSTSYNISKKAYDFANSFKEANILNNPETYELEIEFIGQENNSDNIRRINNFYEKLKKGITDPKLILKSGYDPLSILVKELPQEYVSYDEYMKFPIIEANDTIISLKEELIGKNVYIKDRFYERSNLFDTKILIESGEDIIGSIMDFDEDHDENIPEKYEKGAYVLLQFNINAKDKKNEDSIKKELEKIPNYGEPDFDHKNLLKDKKQIYQKLIKELRKLNKKDKQFEIWIPVTEIYSDQHDIDKIIIDHFTQIKSGGAISDESNSDLDIELLSNKCIEVLNVHTLDMLEIINDTKLIISNSEKKFVLLKYSNLTNQQYNQEKDLEYQYKFKLLGPQPVTLNHEHLNPDSPINIIHGYAVTEKADGYRAMLYILNNKGYLITPKLDVLYTGIKFPNVNGEWLFDGEYITKNKNREDIKLYMIFDIYFNGTPKDIKPIYNHIWYSKNDKIITRSKIIEDFKDILGNIIVDNKEYFNISFKKYEYGAMNKDEDNSLIFEKCRKILDMEESFEYRIDGLILLPIYTKVKGDKSGKDVVNIGGTWDYNFKWKPPEENTIDFKVSFEKEGKLKKDKVYPIITEVENGDKILHRYKKAKLIVGYDQKKDETLDYCMMLLLNERKKHLKEKMFDPPNVDILVNKTNMKLVDNKIICEDGSEMKDGNIVEMRYNPNGQNDMIWVPLRVRHDKTNAQFFTIANNVWETISQPIKENVIRGLEEDVYVKKEGPDDLYYVGDTESVSKALRDYHNFIKSNLIRGVCNSLNKNIQVMDTSIGRGGDIKKYIDEDSRVIYLLGLDIANVNEACRRYYFEGKKPLATFLQADTSLNIKSNECGKDNEHTRIMLDILYGTVKSVKGPYKKFYREYRGVAKKRFDLINSQFSLHYYLKDKDTFDGYLTNINDNLNKGGYFMATFYDGMKLYELLKDKENIEYINSIGEKVYSIIKKYKIVDFNYREENTSNMFGNTIDVFMDSIGQEISEYLVNIDFVIQEMSKIGLELKTPEDMNRKYLTIFKKECLISDGRGGFENILQVLEKLDKKSFDKNIINKFYPRLPEMFKNKELRLLSGLNNYLIFQKK